MSASCRGVQDESRLSAWFNDFGSTSISFPTFSTSSRDETSWFTYHCLSYLTEPACTGLGFTCHSFFYRSNPTLIAAVIIYHLLGIAVPVRSLILVPAHHSNHHTLPRLVLCDERHHYFRFFVLLAGLKLQLKLRFSHLDQREETILRLLRLPTDRLPVCPSAPPLSLV